MKSYQKIEEYGEKCGLSGKKIDELCAVECFLENTGIDLQLTPENIDTNPEDPADIFVKDINRKFN